MSDSRVDEYAARLKRWRDEFATLRDPPRHRTHRGVQVVHALPREQGKDSRSSRRLEFRSVAEVTSTRGAIGDLVADAIRVQQAGLRVREPAPVTPRDYPDELMALMDADPAFRDAFERLTPGRRRGYLLHFNAARPFRATRQLRRPMARRMRRSVRRTAPSRPRRSSSPA